MVHRADFLRRWSGASADNSFIWLPFIYVFGLFSWLFTLWVLHNNFILVNPNPFVKLSTTTTMVKERNNITTKHLVNFIINISSDQHVRRKLVEVLRVVSVLKNVAYTPCEAFLYTSYFWSLTVPNTINRLPWDWIVKFCSLFFSNVQYFGYSMKSTCNEEY